MQKKDLQRYSAMADFIAELLGSDAEVVVYDIDVKAVAYIVNALEDTVIGMSMGEPETIFLEQKTAEKQAYVVNYRALSKAKHKMKSATFFLHDNENKLSAMLTANIRVDKYIELREMINVLIRGQRPDETDWEDNLFYKKDATFLELVQKAIMDELGKYTAAPNRLSYSERMQLIEALNRKGVFTVKGSVTELARLMDTTETSVYRYLNKLGQE
ncbi:MAG: PAS domain-containing protein [Oscillospiraceae bacterium]